MQPKEKVSRRERVPSKQEVRLLRALLREPDAWTHGYLLHQKYGVKPTTTYDWIAKYCADGVLEEDDEVVQGKRRHIIKLNKTGIAFALRRLREAEAEEVYKRGEAATDST